jgi:hypothetical protein
MADTKNEQVEMVEDLQLKLLKSFNTMLDEGTLTPTDRATLVRLLMANGWNLDPARLPKGLKDKITTKLNATDFDSNDPDVVGKIA